MERPRRHCSLWLPAEDARLRQAYGDDLEQLANELGRTVDAVTDRARKLGICEKKLPLTMAKCREAVEHVYGVTDEQIRGLSRRSAVVRARQLSIVMSREFTAASTTAIGRQFNRDHTTILSAIDRVQSLEENNAAFHLDVSQLRLTLATYAAQTIVQKYECLQE